MHRRAGCALPSTSLNSKAPGMTTQALQIGFIEQAHRIYLFDEVYPLSAANGAL